MENLINILAELTVGMVSLVIAYFLIPWLKEKRLIAVVRKAVEAAEKLSEHKSIDKKEYVKKILSAMGIRLSETVEAIIEGCVLELDLLISNVRDPEITDEKDYI